MAVAKKGRPSSESPSETDGARTTFPPPLPDEMIGEDNGQAHEDMIPVEQLPREARQRLWQHLKHAHPDVAENMKAMIEAFGGHDVRVCIKGSDPDLHQALEAERLDRQPKG